VIFRISARTFAADAGVPFVSNTSTALSPTIAIALPSRPTSPYGGETKR
jgi:hypothetical protein